MKKVESSNLEAVGYNEQESILTIEFKNGSTYEYLGVSSALYTGLLSAPSIGSFFNSEISRSFQCHRIKDPWTIPDWMQKYFNLLLTEYPRSFIQNCMRSPLMGRESDFASFEVRYTVQTLETLHKEGLLKEIDS